MLIRHGKNQEQIVQKTVEVKHGYIQHTRQPRVQVEIPTIVVPQVISNPLPPTTTPVAQAVIFEEKQTVVEVPKLQARRSTVLEQGFIIHDNASMTPDINRTRTFHVDPDVPHVIHDKNVLNKNYKQIVFPPVSKGDENDVVCTHSPPKTKLRYLTTTNSHTAEIKPDTVADLDRLFGGDVVLIVETISTGRINFEHFSIEFSNPKFVVVSGEEGMAPATPTTPFVLRTPYAIAVSYLLNTMVEEFEKLNLDCGRLIEVLIDMLSHSTGVKDWLSQIALLWVEIQK